jgi:hypothetical protein
MAPASISFDFKWHPDNFCSGEPEEGKPLEVITGTCLTETFLKYSNQSLSSNIYGVNVKELGLLLIRSMSTVTAIAQQKPFIFMNESVGQGKGTPSGYVTDFFGRHLSDVIAPTDGVILYM